MNSASLSLFGDMSLITNERACRTRLRRLVLIQLGFGCLALDFAQSSLLLLSSLFLLGACACRHLSLGPVSTVIRLECHWLPPAYSGIGRGCYSHQEGIRG